MADGMGPQVPEVPRHGGVAEVHEHLDALGPAHPLAIDTETTGLRLWQGDKLRGYTVASMERSFYIPISHPASVNVPKDQAYWLWRRIQSSPNPLIWHHWKFDAASLSQLDPHHLARLDWDTSVGNWLEDENLDNGLKERSEFLFGRGEGDEKREIKAMMDRPRLKDLTDLYYIKGQTTRKQAEELARADERYVKRGHGDLTAEEMRDYAVQDGVLTQKLYAYQQEPQHKDWHRAVPRELAFQRCLFDMEKLGVRVNRQHAVEERIKAVMRMSELEKHFDINIGSTDQLSKLIYEDWGFPILQYTDSGKQGSTSRAALQMLLATSGGKQAEALAFILEYRRLDKAVSGYFDPLLDRLDDDNRVHAGFRSTKTVTGRLASDNPNLQTIPKENTLGMVRECFEPAPGWELWEYDLSQAEIRLAAALSRDPGLMMVFEEERDLYDEIAKQMGCPRQVAKQVALSYQYFAGVETMAGTLNESVVGQWLDGPRTSPLRLFRLRQVEALRNQFQMAYPRLAWFMNWAAEQARTRKRLPQPWPGYYRHFETLGYKRPDYKDAFNYWTQGGVSQLMRSLMIEGDLASRGGRTVLQVHDSIAAEVQPGEGERIGEYLQKVLDDVNPYPIKLKLEAKKWK